MNAGPSDPARDAAPLAIPRSLLGAFPLAVLVIGVDDRLLDLNERARVLFRGASPGKKFNELEASFRVPGLREAVEAAKTGAPALVLSKATWTRDAGNIVLDVTVCGVGGTDGDPAAVLLTALDSSDLAAAHRENETLRAANAQLLEGQAVSNEELQTLNEELKVANDDLRQQVQELAAAEEANVRKNQFLAMLAHELRNPLAAAVNALHVIRKAAGADRQIHHAVRIADRQLRHEARLLDDLLDVSRIVLGKIALERRSLDLRDCVRTALEGAGFAVQERALRLDVDLPEEPLVVTGDATRLEQCVGNLLSNAVKFTPAGGRVDVSLRREDAQAVLIVRDTGTGIAPEMLERVFDLFTQADDSPVRARGGLGIGLTLVRRLVQLHGGTIDARSAGPSRGSEFELRLPLGSGVVAPPPPEPADACRRRRLLVVEDNRDAREMLRTVLELQGHVVWDASDGAAAVRLAAETSPEVVILDIGLPDMDGFEAGRRIRSRLGQGVRMIALSGYGDQEARQRGQAAGFDAHLVKPVSPEALIEAIDAL